MLAFIEIEYSDAETEVYLLPLGMTQLRRSDEKDNARTAALIARLEDGCLLVEAAGDERFTSAMLDLVGKRRQIRGTVGTLTGAPTRAFRELRGDEALEGQVLKAEQSNTAIVYGQQLFMKLFRRVEAGESVDLEVSRFLTEEAGFANTPPLAGWIEYRRGKEDPATLAMLQRYTRNSGDAWTFTLGAVDRLFEHIVSDAPTAERVRHAIPNEGVFALAARPIPEVVQGILGGYLAEIELLGVRTAEMHIALASRDDIPRFAPEPFTPHYQRSVYQLVRTQTVRSLQLLRRRERDRGDVRELLERESELQQRIRRILEHKIVAQRIRTHGDFHLGQVLHTGTDFIIIDFEGEPARPLSERRIKRNALRDVAGMLRSFHYAPHAVLLGQAPGSGIRSEDAATLEDAARFWHRWVSAAYLRAYLQRSAGSPHLPASANDVDVLLEIYLIEKTLYEIVYELNNRPEWVRIPIRGLLDLM